jgi:RNA polymerase sigma factor (TIGR02999 family)
MRRILIDQARHKRGLKRGGELGRVELEVIAPLVPEAEVDVLALDEALDQLAARDATAAELVKLRFFAGLTAAQAAAVLGVSARTADRIWAYARSFLLKELGPRKSKAPARTISPESWRTGRRDSALMIDGNSRDCIRARIPP